MKNPQKIINDIGQAYEDNDPIAWLDNCESLARWLSEKGETPEVPEALQCGADDMDGPYKFWVTGGGILFETPLGNFHLDKFEGIPWTRNPEFKMR